MPSVDYIKHLVECHCVLPQFKHSEPPVWHQFVVFSEIDEKGAVVPRFCQCNNCGVIHKVTETGRSSILKRETMPSLPTKDDLKMNLPEKFVAILEKYDCELPTYQEAIFIFEHKFFGKAIILTREHTDGLIVGKYVQVIGDTLWRVIDFQEEHDNQ